MGGGIVDLASTGKNNSAHVKGKIFLLVIEFNGTGRAKFFTGLAFALDKIDAIFGIDSVLKGHGLGILYIGRFAFHESCIVIIDDFFGALFRAHAAGNAFFHINIPGILDNFYFKVALVSGYFFYLGQGQ
jgi:hypothetical protein